MVTLTQTENAGVKVLHLSGELTLEGAVTVGPSFEHATPGAGRVVADMAEITVLTTPGITMLLLAMRRAKDGGGRFVLTQLNRQVGDVLRRCRLDTILTVLPSIDDAVKKAKEA